MEILKYSKINFVFDLKILEEFYVVKIVLFFYYLKEIKIFSKYYNDDIGGYLKYINNKIFFFNYNSMISSNVFILLKIWFLGIFS